MANRPGSMAKAPHRPTNNNKTPTVGTLETVGAPSATGMTVSPSVMANFKTTSQASSESNTTGIKSDGPTLLWDLATEKIKNTVKSENKESTVLVVGAKGSGKSTIINNFLDKKESTKETVALECSFGRKMHLGKVTKDVANFWELGGGFTYTNLLEVPISSQRLENMVVVIVVDLSNPSEIWNTVVKLHDEIHKRIEAMRGAGGQEMVQIRSRLKTQDTQENPVIESREVCSCLVPIIIIGNKYDEFQALSLDQKKSLVLCLRFLNVYLGSALIFTDDKSKNLHARVKSLLSHLCFDHSLSSGVVVDYKQPILIPWGKDSFEAVGTPNPIVNWQYSPEKRHQLFEMWERAFVEKLGPPLTSVRGSFLETGDRVADPTTAFEETAIDGARRAKLAEIEKKRREKERERNEEDDRKSRQEPSKKKMGNQDLLSHHSINTLGAGMSGHASINRSDQMNTINEEET